MRLLSLLVTLGVINPFAPPLGYGPGHRGVDFAAEPGQAVLAPLSGRVTYSGVIAGVGTITISQGAVKVTLQPIRPVVLTGRDVRRGESIGVVQEVDYHCSRCLHLGMRSDGRYLNPLSITRSQLLPIGRAAWISTN